MVNLLFLKKVTSKFFLCCMKVRSLRKIIIYYLNLLLNIFVSCEYGKYVIALLENKKNVKFGGI